MLCVALSYTFRSAMNLVNSCAMRGKRHTDIEQWPKFSEKVELYY